MHNDSIETLLLRHYGSMAPVPVRLEQHLVASVRQEAAELRRQQGMAARLRTHRVSRRHAVRLVAIGSAGLGMLGAGMEMLEAALVGQEASQSALP